MRKQKRQMCVRRMLLFFLACVLICAAPPSAAQAAIMQTAKNSTVQKKKTSTKTVTIETSGGITKKKVKSGGSVILPVEVNKRGYTFLGWSTVPGQTCNPMYQAYQKIQVTKNIHLYPVKYKWNQEPDIYAGGLADSVEKYDKIIFVGDSRTAMLRSTLKQQCSSDSLKKVGFVCKTGEGCGYARGSFQRPRRNRCRHRPYPRRVLPLWVLRSVRHCTRRRTLPRSCSHTPLQWALQRQRQLPFRLHRFLRGFQPSSFPFRSSW